MLARVVGGLCVSMNEWLPLFAGWEGTGLGAQHQGIEEPIKSGDVRGKIDKYKVSQTTATFTKTPKMCVTWNRFI